MVKRFLSALLFLAMVMLSSCRSVESDRSGSALKKELTEGTELCLEENGVPVSYIVVSSDYYGKILLLRKNVLDTKTGISRDSSYYAGGEADVFLNSDFLASLGELAAVLPETEIPIVAKKAIGTGGSETETIRRRVFLLSMAELNVTLPEKDGKALRYFRNSENRIGIDEAGKRQHVWTRTPDASEETRNYYITANNYIDFTNCYAPLSLRPALCIDPDAPLRLLRENGNLILSVAPSGSD